MQLGLPAMPEPTSETPILDLQVPLSLRESMPRLLWWQGLLLGIGISAVEVLVACFALYIFDPHSCRFIEKLGGEHLRAIIDSVNRYVAPLFFLAIVATLFFTITLHEVGHFVAAMLVGFDVKVPVLGPIALSKAGSRVSFGVRRRDGTFGFMGVNLGIRGVRKLRRRLIFYVVSGPLADLISVSVVAVILGVDALRGLPAWFEAIMLLWGVVSGIQLVGSLLIRSHDGVLLDGARLNMLTTSRKCTRRLICILAIDARRLAGYRPKTWKRTWVQAAASGKDMTYDAFYGCWQAFAWANDCEDSKKAGQYLEACLRNARIAPKNFRETLIAQASLFQAWSRHDAEKAEKWLALVTSPTKLAPLDQIKVTVALRWAQNRIDEAFASWDEGLALIKALPVGSQEGSEQGWIEWKAKMDARRPAS